MSDKFSILPLKQILSLTLEGLENKKNFFSIPGELFFVPKPEDGFRTRIFDQLLETPIGVAAGPHTQLTQNIVAAWLTGARFIELKTVQTLDELEVSKPCIDMQDEGYNCEWSQELKIRQSFDQYLNAWIIIHILKDKLGWSNGDSGVIFNMSVGYDYQGILKENVQWYLDKMADASIELNKKIEEIKDIYPNVVNLNINPCISDNITLSTMHGCPPEEIEQIGEYLITERKLHTAIKLNPTLLGKEKLREIIDNSGFDTRVPDIAFEHDLKYEDAVGIITRLSQKAAENNVQFSLKLTNTLESANNKNVFSPSEEMMYASGRVLHPVSINLAKKLQEDFDGKLNISFSGGADAFNIADIISSGLYPVTICSDLLKPGGYGRLHQYIENLPVGGIYDDNKKQQQLQYLKQYADDVLKSKRYKKNLLQDPSIKTNRELETFDCINAPCIDACAAEQNIPGYIYHTANGDFDKAFEVILETNSFPGATGLVCDHLCQTKCTRINYDSPVLIREIKRFVTENAKNQNFSNDNTTLLFTDINAAIIGAGPAGLTCAKYLKEAGFNVKVYEEKPRPGGMVTNAIPDFRLEMTSVENDIKRIENLGVKIEFETKIDKGLFEKLRKENDFIFIAAGAQKAKRINLEGQDVEGVFDPLEFLFQVKTDKNIFIGNDVLIVGGGNTAMDAARTSKRLVGKNGSVRVLYRRTIKQMPADIDEIIAAQEEGIEIMELVAPVKVVSEKGKVKSLLCQKMQLGEKDESGRARPVTVPDSEFELKADSIILATGQEIAIDFIDKELLKPKRNSYEIRIPNVFIGGDALRGGSTVINAVGDGRKAAQEIIKKAGLYTKPVNSKTKKDISTRELLVKKAKREYPEVDIHNTSHNYDFGITTRVLTEDEVKKEASRCLYCDEICNICTTVCPNLALFPYDIDPVAYSLEKLVISEKEIKKEKDTGFEVKQKHQILLIADWCNQCGNCNTFCPTSGAPYKEKPHVYLDYNSFLENIEGYYFDTNDKNKILYKKDKDLFVLIKKGTHFEYKYKSNLIKLDAGTMKIIDFDIANKEITSIDTRKAAEMSLILQGVQKI